MTQNINHVTTSTGTFVIIYVIYICGYHNIKSKHSRTKGTYRKNRNGKTKQRQTKKSQITHATFIYITQMMVGKLCVKS